MSRRHRGRAALAALGFSLALSGCVPMTGTASLTLMTRSSGTKVSFEPVGGRVERSECMYWVLLGLGGNGLQTHESTVERILEEHDADVLLDAQFYNESWGVPYLFLMTCATVEGQPAKVVPR